MQFFYFHLVKGFSTKKKLLCKQAINLATRCVEETCWWSHSINTCKIAHRRAWKRSRVKKSESGKWKKLDGQFMTWHFRAGQYWGEGSLSPLKAFWYCHVKLICHVVKFHIASKDCCFCVNSLWWIYEMIFCRVIKKLFHTKSNKCVNRSNGNRFGRKMRKKTTWTERKQFECPITRESSLDSSHYFHPAAWWKHVKQWGNKK